MASASSMKSEVMKRFVSVSSLGGLGTRGGVGGLKTEEKV